MSQQQNPFLHPGRGVKLRYVPLSSGDLTDHTEEIPAGGYSEVVAGHGGLDISFEMVAKVGAISGDVLIEECDDPHAANGGQTYDTVTFTSQSVRKWNASTPVSGFFRINNTLAGSIVVYFQKRIA